MFNKEFKKNLQAKFNEEYYYEGDYTKLIDKLKVEDGGYLVFKRINYLKKLNLVLSLMALLVIILTISISGKIIENNMRNLQKDLGEIILTEEEISIISEFCNVKFMEEKPIYYVKTNVDSSIALYKCKDDGKIFYFIRILYVTDNVTVRFNDTEYFFNNGFYYLDETSLSNKGKNLVEIIVTDNFNSNYIYNVIV